MVSQLLRRFGAIENNTTPHLIKEYLRMVHDWMATFPPQLDVENPDASLDLEHEWIPLHRHMLHFAAYRMMLDPLRPYLSCGMTAQSTKDELQLRAEGVDHALKFLHSLIAFFSYIYLRDAMFHVMLFSLFETSAMLCSTIIHDEDGSLSRRDDILDTVQGSVAVLRKLTDSTWTARILHKNLARITQGGGVVSMATRTSRRCRTWKRSKRR